jgi:hypothetical protein
MEKDAGNESNITSDLDVDITLGDNLLDVMTTNMNDYFNPPVNIISKATVTSYPLNSITQLTELTDIVTKPYENNEKSCVDEDLSNSESIDNNDMLTNNAVLIDNKPSDKSNMLENSAVLIDSRPLDDTTNLTNNELLSSNMPLNNDEELTSMDTALHVIEKEALIQHETINVEPVLSNNGMSGHSKISSIEEIIVENDSDSKSPCCDLIEKLKKAEEDAKFWEEKAILFENERNSMKEDMLKFGKLLAQIENSIYEAKGDSLPPTRNLIDLSQGISDLTRTVTDLLLERNQILTSGIAFKEFKLGNIALFLPILSGYFLAFHVNSPHHFLSEKCKALIGQSQHFQPFYVLGKIVNIEHFVSGAMNTEENPFSLRKGTVYHVLTVVPILNDD